MRHNSENDRQGELGFPAPRNSYDPEPGFDGKTFDTVLDKPRLTGQRHRVFDLMRDSRWRTLDEIAEQTGDPTSSISARIRDFRKKKFGEHQVDRRRRGKAVRGLFEYKLIPRSMVNTLA